MSVRIVASGDQHVGAKHLTTLVDQDRALRELVAAANEADLLLLAGDATHIARPEPQVLSVWGEALRGLSVPVIAVAGNHDGPEVTRVFEHFRGRIHIATTPRVVRLDGLGLDVACLPWLPDAQVRAADAGARTKEEIAAYLTRAAREILRGLAAQRRPDVPLVLITHATIAGAETSTGWSMGNIPTTGYVLPLEELAAFDFVFAGHIHRHQKLADNVVYSGSLLPLDFSETEPKGYISSVVDGVWPGIGWEHVPVTSPRVATWMLNDDQVASRIADGLLSGDLTMPDLLRIRISCTEATARQYPAARISETLYRAGARLVQVEYDIAREDRRRDAGMTADLDVPRAMSRHLADQYPDEAQATRLEKAAAAAYLEELETSPEWAGGDLAIRALEAKDFLGLADARLELAPEDRLIALCAPVGVGKSTLGADVARFALFGSCRAGDKVRAEIVRAGAEVATAAVEISDAQGDLYRIVRKVKADGRGRASSSLDVLVRDGGNRVWNPISSGKVADGEAQIARILGGLTDDSLSAANFVLQREADRFTMRARREERRRLIAEAAGLGIYGELAERAQVDAAAAARDLERLQAKADPLRARVELIEGTAQELIAARELAGAAATAIAELEGQQKEAERAIEKARGRATEHGTLSAAAVMLHEDLRRVEADLQKWNEKLGAATRILGERAALEKVQGDLEKVRARITEISEAQAAEATRAHTANTARAAAIAKRAALQEACDRVRSIRERSLAGVAAELKAANRQRDELAASGCLERCSHAEACTVASAAALNEKRIRELLASAKDLSERTAIELEAAGAIAAVAVPDPVEPDLTGYAVQLQQAREREALLVKAVAVADKLAAAEQVVKEHDEATSALRARQVEAREQLAAKNAALLGFGGDPSAEVARAQAALDGVLTGLVEQRHTREGAVARVALLEGRLGTYEAAREELAGVEVAIAAAAQLGADQAELVRAWRAVRVAVLETSVIPAIEDTANEILRMFPYGLQIALRTQREKKGGDGTAEALDIEVLGGMGPLYEFCSGGQKTVLDLATHLALTLVVSRRASARLTFVFVDEPEGLDDVGRAAFAGVMNWVSEEFGLQVLVASHHEDLVGSLGGRRITFEGEPGNARVVTREAVAA